MSDTPRTDTLLVVHNLDPKPSTLIQHARQLERELAAANRKIHRLVEIGNSLAIAADENPYNGSLVTQWNDEWTAAKEEIQ